MNSSDNSPNKIEGWLVANNYGKVVSNTPLSGGCINATSHLITESRQSFCLKQNANADDDFFQCEATGLAHLLNSKTVRVPKVVHVNTDFLLLEFIAEGHKNSTFWETLGQELANCHQQSQNQFGFVEDNYCGLTPQVNMLENDGFYFFAEHRLLVQSQLARDKGLLNKHHCEQIDIIAQRLQQWIPEQAPALLHGDLWGGNIHCDIDGDPVLIDPACYWGWPEADLAMTTLFGEFNSRFYQAYQQQRQLEPGWRARLPLYNLYHLLNHLNLFGSSYLGQVEAVIKRFR